MRISVPPLLARIASLLLLGILAVGIGYGAYRWSEAREYAQLQQTGKHRLDLYTASLGREIEKYAYFPNTLGLEQNVLELLRHPHDKRRVGEVNRYLEQLNASASTLSIYVLDRQGRVLASSNWQRPDSFIGEDLSYRPYYQDAITEGHGQFFGVGTTVGEPGYYLSSALGRASNLLGVAVVKVGLDLLEHSWSSAEVPVLVEDENGIVILSSLENWKFRAMHPLDATTRRDFDNSYKYNRRTLEPFPGTTLRTLDTDSRLMQLSAPPLAASGTTPQKASTFLAQSRILPGTAWRLTVFSHAGQVEKIALMQGALATTGATLILICLAMAAERRRRMRDRLAAREALQRANDELERKVETRTLDLSAANSRLQEEVEERTRAERTLRNAQDELVQASKLAVIGQLSTSIAHELNQPLAALSTLSHNAIRLQKRGDHGMVESNLERICQMVDHMGRLTGHLKTFARKSSGAARKVPVQQALNNALYVQEQRIRRQHTLVLREQADAELAAWCDPIRLEQVLINLIGNAIDAMEGCAQPQLQISITQHGGFIHIQIQDNGPGLDEDTLRHMFEPFYTTKEAGVGLGLGLSISAGIVRDFGGTLTGANAPERGALFTLEIPAREED
jgi:two-component system C4-dicarboxylate transport sensor histidine kinase DctB